jgi:predicted cation transporter
VRVYAFIAALVLLGTGVTPLVDRYIVHLAAPLLFWANSVSAILDNATLAAAEIGPSLSGRQISAALLGLLISGGMLIPGNVPNIIAANRLKIGSSEWARYAVPVGAAMMLLCFCVWLVVA